MRYGNTTGKDTHTPVGTAPRAASITGARPVVGKGGMGMVRSVKQITVCAGSGELNNIAGYHVDKQPIRLNVKFAKAFPITA